MGIVNLDIWVGLVVTEKVEVGIEEVVTGNWDIRGVNRSV